MQYIQDKPNTLEFGLYSLGDHLPNPATGKRIPAQQRIQELIQLAKLADEAGIDVFSIGESHQEGFTTQAHAVVLAAIAQATKQIRVASTSTIISTSDPVRVFENFATIDLISGGRAEIVAGRASRIGLFELLGYDLRDYEALYEEKFDLLLKIRDQEILSWQGQFRAPLNQARVLPRPIQEKLPVWRAVGGTPSSAVKAGRAGVPMVLAHLGGPVSVFKQTVDLYRETLEDSGFDSSEIPVATAGFFHIAETSQQALAEYYPHINEGMKITNGQGFPKQAFAQAQDPHSIINLGSPQQVLEKILYQHEQFNNQRYIAQMDFGGVPFTQLQRNIEFIAEKILPGLRTYTKKSTEPKEQS